MDHLAYLDRSIATYDGDPPSNDYQRGCLDTLKIARAELATLQPTACAVLDIAGERRRQIEAEGWTPDHDDAHGQGELATAAACYAMGDHRIIAWSYDGKNEGEASLWPWHRDWWKPADRRRNRAHRPRESARRRGERMKHFSPAALAGGTSELLTEAAVKERLREQLDGARGEKGRLAERLGITRVELSMILNGHSRVRPGVAAALGFRKVARFEPIE